MVADVVNLSTQYLSTDKNGFLSDSGGTSGLDKVTSATSSENISYPVGVIFFFFDPKSAIFLIE